jgi:hypothetical protein
MPHYAVSTGTDRSAFGWLLPSMDVHCRAQIDALIDWEWEETAHGGVG